MKKQKINIYYHSDLDGIFSAILVAKMYLDNNVFCSFKFFPVNYDIKDWQTKDLDKADTNIVVDFPYHPQAHIWYDHHLSGWGEIAPCEVTGRFDNTAPSCCAVIINDPKRMRFKNEKLMKYITDGVSICDYALYSTPDEPYNMNKWYSALRMSLMEDSGNGYMDELIKLFINLDQSLKNLERNMIPDISLWRAAKVNFAMQKGYKTFSNSYIYENKIVHFQVPPYEKFDRYFPYKAEPTAMYAVYVKDNTWASNPSCYISVAKNPFEIKDPNVNIKEICGQFGGGGHIDVGGITVTTLEEALTIKEKVTSLLITSVIEFEKATNGF